MNLAPVPPQFKFDAAPSFNPRKEDDGPSIADLWLEEIKKQARANLDNGYEYLRISWHQRWNKPKYDKFEDYTPEEAVIETWEQYYLSNPDSIELKGIYKRKNKKTGYSYYVTGDPLLDKMEEAFGRGETPDLRILDRKGGKDIFRAPVFTHTENVVGGRGSIGDTFAPRSGGQGVQINKEGDKISASGSKIKHDDYKNSDDWIKDMLKDDPGLAAIAEKLNGPLR